MKRIVLAASILALSVPAAPAAQLVHIISVKGTCQELVLGDKTYTDGCNDAVWQMIYDNGRNGFYIGPASDRKVLFAFSGFDGEKPTLDGVLLNVDTILYSPPPGGTTPTSVAVTGTCVYGNPYLAATNILCSAKDEAGKFYTFKFHSDGSKPQKIM